MDDAEFRAFLSTMLADAPAGLLSRRERLVLHARLNHAWTLAATGAWLGISRERVRQIERRAMQKLGGLDAARAAVAADAALPPEELLRHLVSP